MGYSCYLYLSYMYELHVSMSAMPRFTRGGAVRPVEFQDWVPFLMGFTNGFFSSSYLLAAATAPLLCRTLPGKKNNQESFHVQLLGSLATLAQISD